MIRQAYLQTLKYNKKFALFLEKDLYFLQVISFVLNRWNQNDLKISF